MPKKIAQTESLYLAAAYIAHGASMTKVDKTNPRNMIFHFEWFAPEVTGTSPVASMVAAYHDPIERLEVEWVNGNLLFRYAEAIRSLKSIVHSRA